MAIRGAEHSETKEKAITAHFVPFGRKNLNLNSDREKLLSKIGTLITLVLIYEKAVENGVKYFLVNTRFEDSYNFMVKNLGENLVDDSSKNGYFTYKKSIIEVADIIPTVRSKISILCSKKKITEKEIKAVFNIGYTQNQTKIDKLKKIVLI